jgi:hypothetical protein
LGVVGDFDVDLATGVVTQDGVSASIDTPGLAELRQRLFALRAANRISSPEATCLVRLSVDPSGACDDLRVTREDDSFFEVEGTCANIGRDRKFVVDRYTGIVSDAVTGKPYSQAIGESLRQRLLASRLPTRLTADEAKDLLRSSLVVPGSGIPKCLTFEIDPAFNADETWFQAGACGSADITRVIVDMLLGDVRIIGRSLALDPSRFDAARATALADAKSRQSSAAESARRDCP